LIRNSGNKFGVESLAGPAVDAQFPPLRRRLVLAALIFFATALNYMDRQILSFLSPLLRAQFRMTNMDYANVVDAFLLAYSVMYLLGGRLVDRIGTRLGMALSVTWWSVAECLHSVVHSALQLGISRSLLAIGEAIEIPGAEKLIAEAFPPSQRPLAISFFMLGSMVGATIAPPVAVGLAKLYGWRFVFLSTGLLGFVWTAVWMLVIPTVRRQAPKDVGGNDSANSTEKATLTVQRTQNESEAMPLSFRVLLANRITWGVLVARFFLDSSWYFYLFWIVEFLKKEKEFSLQLIGLLGWIPFLCADIGVIVGGATVSVLQSWGWTPNRSHKTVMFAGIVFLFSPFILANTASQGSAILWISAGVFGIQIVGANFHAIPTQVFHAKSVGTVEGLAGACGSIGGVLLTKLIGYITDHYGSYSLILEIMGTIFPVMIFASILLLGKIRWITDEKPWPRVPFPMGK
jgi:ACS family hexuronate transporter-like MFS transporter